MKKERFEGKGLRAEGKPEWSLPAGTGLVQAEIFFKLE